MAYRNEKFPTLINGETSAVAAGTRVKLGSVDGEFEVAGLTDPEIGILLDTVQPGRRAAIDIAGNSGLHLGLATGSISRGDTIYTAASGKYSATGAATSYGRGIAWQDAADGQLFNFIWTVGNEVAES